MKLNLRRLIAFWLGGWFTFWVAGTVAATGLLGAGVSAYGASQAASAARSGRIDPNQVANTQADIQRRLGPDYTRSQASTLQQGLMGSIDWGAFARSPRGAQLLANSQNYYADNPEFANPETRLQDMYNNGYLNPADLPHDNTGIAGTLGTLQATQDQGNADSASYQRKRNAQDMAALAPGAAALGRQLNPEYYNALGALGTAAGQPINASPYETAYGALALKGSPTFALGGGGQAGGNMGGGYGGGGRGGYGGGFSGGTTGGNMRGFAQDVRGQSSGGLQAAAVAPGAPASSTSYDKAGNPMATTSGNMAGEVPGAVLPPTDGTTGGNMGAGLPPTDGMGYGNDMLFPGGQPPAQGDSSQMALGRVDERVAGPGRLTRQMTRGALDTTTGPAALENTLYGQAQAALAQGGDLTAQEQRLAQASSAAATGARGLGDTNSALAAEVLNLDSARRSRLDSNRAFASGVDTQLRSGQASDRSYGLNLDSADLSRTGLRTSLQQANIRNTLDAATFNANQRQADLAALGGANSMYTDRSNTGFNRLATSANLASSNLFNPYSVLGNVGNQVNSQSFLGQGMGYYTGVPDYSSGAAQNNANANSAAAINSANAYSALGGGLMSAAGSVGSAYIRGRTSTNPTASMGRSTSNPRPPP